MRKLFPLTVKQMERLQPLFPTSRAKPMVDGRRALSGMIVFQRNGVMWQHAPAAGGPPKTLCNPRKRWIRMGAFATIMTELAAQSEETEIVMV